ncbi:MAG: TIGR02147 family protein [Bdellovibrionota bacterium]
MFLGEQKLKEILMTEFMNSKTRNSSYSMRAFSRKVGIPQSAISEILGGKRSITSKMALKIMNGLSVTSEQISEVFGSNNSNKPDLYKSLEMTTFDVISDWHHFAIISLIETKSFQSRPDWISKRLGISLKAVKDSLNKLQALDLIKVDPKSKRISLTNEQVAAISPVATAALKKANRQNLDLALDKLESTKFEERDFTAITMCFDPGRMEEAKKLIKDFRRKFCKTMESGNRKEVYKLCVQLFPLSKIQDTKN